jgi:sigma-54-specific transcriptional regulator
MTNGIASPSPPEDAPGTGRHINAAGGRLITHPDAGHLGASARASALVFNDAKSLGVLRLIRQVAPSEANLLIIGETGTGKEIVARHIHRQSPRRDRPFVAVNCGAFSESLVDSELFGHEKGSFTGAGEAKAGWFETASGGTLFLDEIGDLPLAMQVKLLRVLQEREVVRVGGRKPIPIDVRLLAATNIDLTDAVAAGRFRADLYYRLKVVTVALPPLRERPGDIPHLVEHFVDRYGQRLGTEVELNDEAMAAVLAYAWPGNIRELENVIHRAVLVSQQGRITVQDLHLPIPVTPAALVAVGAASAPVPAAPSAAAPPAELPDLLRGWFARDEPGIFDRVERETIMTAFEHVDRNQVQAARLLGISRNVLRAYLKRYGVIR